MCRSFWFGPTLTCDFAIDHDVQVLLWVGAGVPGDGVQADLGIVQRKTQTRTIEPGERPEKVRHTAVVR